MHSVLYLIVTVIDCLFPMIKYIIAVVRKEIQFNMYMSGQFCGTFLNIWSCFSSQILPIMPKVSKESVPAFLKRMVQEFPRTFRADDVVLFCLCCEGSVNATQLFQVKQHIATQKHINAKLRKEEPGTNQALLTQFQLQSRPVPKLNHFNMQLANTFLRAGIPLHKIGHPAVEEFISEFTSFTAASVSELRKSYVPILYEECFKKMRRKAADNFI